MAAITVLIIVSMTLVLRITVMRPINTLMGNIIYEKSVIFNNSGYFIINIIDERLYSRS